ncbi:HSP20-like chaperone [Aspergillus heterothallicus]
MSLFQTIPFQPSDWSPLFHLLDDYDTHRSHRSRGNGQGRSQKAKTPVRTFTPRFDVRETSDAYHLDGELPGIAQSDIEIEFTDPQTLLVKGRAERAYHSSSSSTPSTPSATEGDSADKSPEGEATASGDEVIKSSATDKQVSTAAEKPRYWVRERSVGEFQRSFSFPERVSQDDVKASLRDGVLSVVVPKVAPPAMRKIAIQ